MRRLLLVMTVTLAHTAAGQSTPMVNPADPVYGFIDRLFAAGIVDSAIVGQRPSSVREIRRTLGIARRNIDRAGSSGSWITENLARYEAMYESVGAAAERSWYPALDVAGVDFLTVDSPSRGIENMGIQVALNPLLANRQGTPAVDGTTAAAYLGASMSLGKRFVLGTTVRGGVRGARAESVAGDLRPEQLYLRGLFGNVAISVGRDHLFFGQSANGSMFNSLNARALDMVRVASERPFKVALASRLLGPMAGTFYVADLGRAAQRYPHTKLIGYKLSMLPWRNLELGVTTANQMGGKGGPDGTFAQRLADLVPVLDGIFLHRNLLFSNKLAGIDARLRIPAAKGLQLYMDGAVDDFDMRRFKSSVTEDGGYVWGASLDCLTDCGAVRLTAEYHTTGLRYYTHGFYSSGYTLDKHIIGSALGPKGQAGYLALDVDRMGRRLALTAAHEIRSGNIWGTTSTTPNDSDFRFILLESHPSERRWRLVASLDTGHPTDRVTWRVAMGAEHVTEFAFVQGSSRNNVLAEFSMQIHPRGKRRP